MKIYPLDVIENVLSCFFINREDSRIECNHCSYDNYVFGEDLAALSWYSVAQNMLRHRQQHHSENDEAATDVVTEQEVQAAIQSITATTKGA